MCSIGDFTPPDWKALSYTSTTYRPQDTVVSFEAPDADEDFDEEDPDENVYCCAPYKEAYQHDYKSTLHEEKCKNYQPLRYQGTHKRPK